MTTRWETVRLGPLLNILAQLPPDRTVHWRRAGATVTYQVPFSEAEAYRVLAATEVDIAVGNKEIELIEAEIADLERRRRELENRVGIA